MRVSGIYSIVHIESGKTYVGSSINIKQRWNKHRSALNRGIHCNPHLQNSWTKYGKDAFTFSIIEQVESADLEIKENEYIEKFGIVVNGVFLEDIGYNTNWAGRTGCINNPPKGENHYAYGKEGLRKGKKMPEWFGQEQSNRMIGTARHNIPHSAASKIKMSESKKNKPWSDARREAQNKRKQGVSL